jgi:hypothetical protein
MHARHSFRLALILAGSAALFQTGCQTIQQPSPGEQLVMKGYVYVEPFGQTQDGQAVESYTLRNAHGLTAKVMTYGAILTEMHVPDRAGNFADVTLGFDDLESYLKGHPFFGATTGRYANRIAAGKFTLDGKEYTLAVNN